MSHWAKPRMTVDEAARAIYELWGCTEPRHLDEHVRAHPMGYSDATNAIIAYLHKTAFANGLNDGDVGPLADAIAIALQNGGFNEARSSRSLSVNKGSQGWASEQMASLSASRVAG
jgi:hypothetical protein